MKDEKVVQEMLNKVSDKVMAISDGSEKEDGGSFEDGVEVALGWVLHDESEPPIVFRDDSV